MNSVHIGGRLTKDVELKATQSGMSVAIFSIAMNRGKDKDGNDRGADFPNCVAFGKTAENISKFFRKGDYLLAEGRIQTGNYDDKDGKKVYKTKIVIDRFHFTGGRRSDSGMNVGGQGDDYIDDDFHLLADDDDVPF